MNLLLLPKVFGEKSFLADISPYPYVSNPDEDVYIVKVDGASVVHCDDRISAVTALFSSYWIFDIRYANENKRTLELLEKCVFKVTAAKPGQAVLRFINSL